ncbi:hypothetical protein N7467_001848 [Penicillium canescens]|nr:hypothetical protein N7467_001848 [Penicillium canescens]
MAGSVQTHDGALRIDNAKCQGYSERRRKREEGERRSGNTAGPLTRKALTANYQWKESPEIIASTRWLIFDLPCPSGPSLQILRYKSHRRTHQQLQLSNNQQPRSPQSTH